MSDNDSTVSTGSAGSSNLGRIGPYRLLSILGEGGMGIVYLAEQDVALRRRVALKVIKPGMDSKQVLARFESERQALALMNHPNIARIFDAGVTERGHPYFVMEHIAGSPITDYCDRHEFTTRQRLELFRSVCAAIHHAHSRGILHRDLKPSNVLIAEEDGRPVPKVIDFGVAKATSQPLTERTLFTEQGVLIGTPEYMSPEQAEMGAEGIDARTDVYSLGVLLYELLVGAPPLDPKAIRGAGYAEMQRIIRDEEPPTPSEKIGFMVATASEISRRRGRDVRGLRRDLRGDLDAIVLKAMRKQRAQRYPAVADMGADIDRYLRGDRVAARRAPWRMVARLRPIAVAACLSIATGMLVAAMPIGRDLEWRGLDLLFLLRGPRAAPRDVAIVALDEASLRALQVIELPFPRSLHANLLRKLKAQGARAVAFNVLFVGPEAEPLDLDFATAVADAGNVVLGASHTMTQSPHVEITMKPYGPLTRAATSLGSVDLLVEHGSVRYVAHPLRDAGLAAEAVRIGSAIASIHVDENSLIDYYGPRGSISTVSLYQALEPARYLPDGFLKKRIVFVGAAYPPGLWPKAEIDNYRTPFGLQSGTDIHATIAANLLEGRRIIELPAPIETALRILVPLLAAALLISARPLAAILAFGALEGVVAVAALVAFGTWGLWCPFAILVGVQAPIVLAVALARPDRHARSRP